MITLWLVPTELKVDSERQSNPWPADHESNSLTTKLSTIEPHKLFVS